MIAVTVYRLPIRLPAKSALADLAGSLIGSLADLAGSLIGSL